MTVSSLRQPQPDAIILLSKPEVEAAFLGAVLQGGDLLDSLSAIPKPDDFGEPLHKRIFARIIQTRGEGRAVCAALVAPFFEGEERRYIASLSQDGQGVMAFKELAAEIIGLSVRRKARERCLDQADAYLDLDKPLSDLALPDDLRPSRVVATPFKWKDPATIPPRPWVVDRWLLLSSVACVVAPGGTGKSTFISSLAVSLASGRVILGKDLPRGRQRVWLWNLEDDMDEMDRSIEAAALHHGIAAEELEGWLLVDTGMDGATLCTARDDRDGFHLDTGVFNDIAAEIKRRGVGVLIIDPFVSSHQVDESNNGKIDTIAKAWARVAKATNSLVILVHHVSKAGAGDVTANSSRGAVSLINAARSVLVINRMDEAEADRLGINPAERRRYIRIGDDKSNRAPAAEADWFRIASFELGNGDNVGALEPWNLPDPFDDVTLDDLRAVQARIGEGEWRENYQAKAWAGRLVGEVLGIDVDQKPGRAKASAILSQWIKSGALRIEQHPDGNRERRPFVVMGEPA